MSEWTIRSYHPDDEDDLVGVWLAATIPGQAFLPEAFWRGQEDDVRRELLPNAETWVVDDDGRLAAFVALIGDLIGGLFTHPEYQGRGMGRALVEHAAARHDPVYVEVFAANSVALAFYGNRGFEDHESHADPDTGLTLLHLVRRSHLTGLTPRRDPPRADRTRRRR